jgi:cytochrome c2
MKMQLRNITRALFGLLLILSAGFAFADDDKPGDAEKGAAVFKKCKACHKVGEDAKNGAGPVLNGVIGRQAGSDPTFEYGSDLIEAGSAGLVWTESKIAEFIENPKEFLRETLNKPRARSSMTLKFSNKEDRRNVAAYIATFSDSAAATTPEN